MTFGNFKIKQEAGRDRITDRRAARIFIPGLCVSTNSCRDNGVRSLTRAGKKSAAGNSVQQCPGIGVLW